MTTHEATALQPSTLIHHAVFKDAAGNNLAGVARLDAHDKIRIVWDDLAEPNTVLMAQDRIALASIIITNMDDPSNC